MSPALKATILRIAREHKWNPSKVGGWTINTEGDLLAFAAALIAEVVPEEKPLTGTLQIHANNRIEGFNACRNEILRGLEK